MHHINTKLNAIYLISKKKQKNNAILHKFPDPYLFN